MTKPQDIAGQFTLYLGRWLKKAWCILFHWNASEAPIYGVYGNYTVTCNVCGREWISHD